MRNPPKRISWWTRKRLRAHGTILAVCLWSLYVWNLAPPGLRDRNGNIKGTDFLHFYTLGRLALEHRGTDLYDMNAQAAIAARRVPETASLRYLPLYPPQLAIFFAPLAHLSYGWALALWWIASAVVYGVCCYSIWRVCPNLSGYGGNIVLLAAGFPAFFHLIAWGQTSALALACFTAMFFLMRDGREFLAGLIVGCLIFKPQLGLAAAVVFASIAAWRILAGAVLSAAAQLSLGVFYFGIEPLRRWIRLLLNVRSVLPMLEPKPYQTHCLRTFWSMLVPSQNLAAGLYVASAIAVLGLTIAVWRRKNAAPLSLRYSALLLSTVLVSPHLTVYDLVILAPAILLLADWLVGQLSSPSTRLLGTLLYLVYILPLVGPLAPWTHVQLSVIAMAAVVYAIFHVARRAGSMPSRAAIVTNTIAAQRT